MPLNPSSEPTRYDTARVARLEPIRAAVEALGLPFTRARKLGAVLNALEMQIEDGGDSPEVNAYLLDALRAGVRYQVGEQSGHAALQAIDVFAQSEARRWEQVQAGTLPPIEVTSQDAMYALIQDGYVALEAGQTSVACDQWLPAWDLVKRLAQPPMRTVAAFDRVYGDMLQDVETWSVDLVFELGNAGLADPRYYEHVLRYAEEYLALFPDSPPSAVVTMRRAQGEALWHLGRQPEAEATYAALTKQLPDEGWAYIGWADQYTSGRDATHEYARAEAILQQGLGRPRMEDREYLLDRLVELYGKWGKPQEQAAAAAQRKLHAAGPPAKFPAALPAPPPAKLPAALPAPLPAPRLAGAPKLGRNAPCWCGSGKKYKHCHLDADAKAR